MLVLPFFSVLALAPVLQGLFDFPLQTAFQAVIFFSCLLWVLSALRHNYTGVRPPKAGGFGINPQSTVFDLHFSIVHTAVIAAAALSFCSMMASPVRALIWPEWGNLFAGFLLFIFSGFLSPEDKKITNLALRAAAWAMAAIAVVQIFVLKSPQISGSLTNPNALALFVVMVLPLAVSWKDWWLAGAMLVILVWTRSMGAALALTAAVGLYAWKPHERAEFKKTIPLLVLSVIALALVISQVPPQSFVHRLLWWKSAFLMFLDRPLFGFGHAAFTFVSPAYGGAMSVVASSSPHLQQAMGSIYAHSYYLEFLAENGIFCAALWFGLMGYAVKKKTGLAKYSLVAALAHSVIDFGLSVPANFWIFCCLAAPEHQGGADPSRPQEHRGAEAQERAMGRGRLLFPAATCVIAAAWLNLCVTHNTALRERSRAAAAYAEGKLQDSRNKFTKALEIENGPAPLEALGKIDYRLAFERKDRGMLFSSAVFFERALLLNPYSASAYRDLAGVYSAGEDKLLTDLEERKKRVFK